MESKVTRATNAAAAALGLLPKDVPAAHTSPNYPLFLKENSLSSDELKKQREKDMSGYPLVSIILFAEGCDETDISSTVLSLTTQTYRNTEIIIAAGLACSVCDRFSGFGNVRTIISDGSSKKLIESCEAVLRGKYVMFLKAGDRLNPEAIFLMTVRAFENGNDLVYADNDHHDEFGNRVDPRFKPSFSPVTENCFDYIGRPLLVSRKLHASALGFEGAEDIEYHRYVIRCCMRCKRPSNIPRVLCTCRQSEKFIEQQSIPVPTGLMSCLGLFVGSYRLFQERGGKRSVSVVIAGASDTKELMRCINSIDTRNVCFDLRIIISVRKDIGTELRKYLDALKRNKAAKTVYSEESSMPALLNAGAAEAFSEYLIFLSPDAEVLSFDFAESLLAPLMIEGVGICGGKLIDPDGMIMHSGTVIGLDGSFGSPYEGTMDDMSDLRKCFYTALQRNVTAVSGSFMAVSSEDFLNIGLFDETLSAVGWDTEFCIRAARKGLSAVFTPYARARMYTANKKLADADELNKERFMDEFRELMRSGDPYCNPNYDMRYTYPQIAIRGADIDKS